MNMLRSSFRGDAAASTLAQPRIIQKLSRRSCGRRIVKAEHPTKSLTPTNGRVSGGRTLLTPDQPIVQALVIALMMIMDYEFFQTRGRVPA